MLGAEIMEDESDNEVVAHKTLNHNSLYYSFTERYFTTYRSQSQMLYQHSNGVFVVGVQIKDMRPFKIEDAFEFQEVKGKKKRGGMHVRRETVLARLHFPQGVIQPVYCLIEGTVIELNKNVTIQNIGTPQGYLAIINPDKKYKVDTSVFLQIKNPTH